MTTAGVEAQVEAARRLINKQLKKGDTWYLLDNTWYKQWKKYVGYNSWDTSNIGQQSAYPGAIDNKSLLTDKNELKVNLKDGLDYLLVPEELWRMYVSWYGLLDDHQAIARKVIELGMIFKHYEVEIYLMDLKLALKNQQDNVVRKSFSRGDTMQHLQQTMKQLFCIPNETAVILLSKYMSNTYERLTRLDETIQEIGLYQDQLVVIKTQSEYRSRQSGAVKCPKSDKPQTDMVPVTPKKHTNSVEGIITCAICLSIMVNPQALPCLHTFCETCIRQLKRNVKFGKQGFLCPICREFATLKDLKTNFTVNQLIEMHTVSKDVCFCDIHPTCKIEALCKECQVEICSKCKFQDHDTHPSQSIQCAVENYLPSLTEKINQWSNQKVQMKVQCDELRKQKNTLGLNLVTVISSVKKQKQMIEERLNDEYGKAMDVFKNVITVYKGLKEKESRLKESTQKLEVKINEISSLRRGRKDILLLRNLKAKRKICDRICESENIEVPSIKVPKLSFQKSETSNSLLGNMVLKKE